MAPDPEPTLRLRGVAREDLGAFYEHQTDPVSIQMAAFPSRDRAAFEVHWDKILADPGNSLRTVLIGDEVAGYVAAFPQDGKLLVGYWIGREFWGRGIATRALAELVREVKNRPLHALVAVHNAASIRVLEKVGFRRSGDSAPATPSEVSYVLP